MPAAQLLNTAIEKLLNQLLRLDPDSPRRLVPLAGKQLAVTLKEFPWPLIFAFSEQVDLLSGEQANENSPPIDCHISLSLESLQAMQDSSQISQLIKQDKLQLEGDIHVAQHFSALLKDLHIDWEEILSQYVGDVVAHQSFYSARTLFDQAQAKMTQFSAMFAEAAIEEKGLAAHPVAVDKFCAQVSELRSDTERLAARLARLEQSNN
jgi:ubiquinone biosynthesis accessory factor UbiJ